MPEDLDRLMLRGRCRSGRRWFWSVVEVDGERVHGWEDTEDGALSAAEAATAALAGGDAVKVLTRQGTASQELRRINTEKRKTQQGEGSGAAAVEYLYGLVGGGFDGSDEWVGPRVVQFRITKRTARRVYYVRREGRSGDPEVGFVDRQVLESAGEVVRGGGGWWSNDYRLYAQPPVIEAAPKPASVAELKAAMHAAHPDRGGSHEDFIAARARYERATAKASA